MSIVPAAQSSSATGCPLPGGDDMSFLGSVDVPTLIWLFPILYLLHDSEEIAVLESWSSANSDRLRVCSDGSPFLALILHRIRQVTTAEFGLTIAGMFGIFYMASYLASQGSFMLFAGCLGVLFFNALIHVIQALSVRGYVPGLVTALGICLPYALLTYDALIGSGVLTWGRLGMSLPAALLVVTPVIAVAQGLGREWLRTSRM